MPEPQLASNNPFRRKGPVAAAPPAPPAPPPADPDFSSSRPYSPSPSSSALFEGASTPTPPPILHHHNAAYDEFRDQLRALPKSSEAPPSTTFQKPKPVKKVRVQSPPPSSPDSTEADFEARFPASGPRYDEPSSESDDGDEDEEDGDNDDDPSDPFGNAAGAGARLGDAAAAPPSASSTPSSSTLFAPSLGGTTPPSQRRPPPNPFQRTLGDLEQTSSDAMQAVAAGAEHPGTPVGKGSLDVDSFRRLLLTGQSGSASSSSLAAATGASVPAQLAPSQHGLAAGDAASITDASSISRQSIFDTAHAAAQETPRTSHEISETEDERSGLVYSPQTPSQRHTLRKKPPPPSSRHGKMIKLETTSAGAGGGGSGGGGNGNDSPENVTVAAITSTPKPAGLTLTTAVSPTPITTSIYPSPGSRSGRPSSSSSDLNKPLPPPPARRSIDEDPESVFDREAAGKIPEVDVDPDAPEEAIPPPRPPTPPNASHATSTAPTTTPPSSGGRPAPPPRRLTHGRSGSIAPSASGAQGTQPLQQPPPPPLGIMIASTAGAEDPDPDPIRPRSSLESTHSRSSSIIKLSMNAPAPPPPRKSNHAARPSISFASPSSVSFTSSASGASSPSMPATAAADAPDRSPLAAAGTTNAKDGRLSPAHGPAPIGTGPAPTATPSKNPRPPPPPARNPSVRAKEPRGAHRENMAPTGAAATSSGPAPPRPPPPRQRGSSRGSLDGPVRRASADSTRRMRGSVTEAPAEAEEDQAARDILADLDALQREVDALRGRYAKAGSAG